MAFLATLLTITNVVGAVTVGTFVRADARTLTIRSGTVERTISWTVLCPEDRERILIDADALPMPPSVRSIRERLDEETARIDKMRESGWLTEEAAARQRDAERRNALWRLSAQEKAKRLTPAAAAYFRRTLDRRTE